ncbi:unnamed protein product, partial [Laminaria digitata]
DLSANDGGPHAWDEGWAFYAGSLEGVDGSGDGFMIHALADKRCENFATCTADDDGSDISGNSAVNAEMLKLFKEGQVKLYLKNSSRKTRIFSRILRYII